MRSIACCLLLFVFFTACNQADDSKRIEVMNKDVRIAYNSCGVADTTLLFVHGWCINKEYWSAQEKYFCPKYKVVSIDLPGFGQSGKNRTEWNFAQYTADIKAVVDQLHLKNVILIGHSMSGDILLEVSNKYPSLVAGIVGIDNLHEPEHILNTQEKKDAAIFLNMLQTSFDSTVNNYMRPDLFQPATDTAIVQRVMQDVFTTDSSIATKVLTSLMNISQTETQLMQGLSHKLYLVNSDVVPVKTDSLAKYCSKGFHVETVHGASHYPMIEKPAEFNTALQKVIDDISSK